MIPRTFPSTFAANGQQQMVVYSLPSITGLTAWIDYIPVKGVTTESATLENTYANGGYQVVDSLASLTGKQAWLDYIPVYEDASYTKPWSTDAGGYIPTSALAALLLDFTSGRLDPRITFSRTTNATLTNSAGLVANAPMNLLTFSEQFDNAAWLKSGVTVSANAIAAPNGSLTADKIIETVGTVQFGVYVQTTLPNSSTNTYSIYAKAGERTWMSINTIDGANRLTWFNLADGSIGTQNAGHTANITPVGDGWYRCSVTYTRTNGAQFACFSPAIANNGYNYTGDGTSGIFIWGAQLELGSTATTYNPTTVKNLLGFTEHFDNAAWTKSNASITSGFTDIYGQPFAQKLIASASTTSHQVEQTVTVSNGSVLSISVYAKAAERNWLVIYEDSGASNYAFFNLSTGTLGTVNAGTASITPIGDGWYRCSLTHTQTMGTAERVRINTTTGNLVFSSVGDGTSGIYIFGAQLSDSASVDPYVYQPVEAPSSVAYYGPRFDYDPVTLAPKGLLIEEQRTNLLTYSTAYGGTWNSNAQDTITQNSTASPDGTVSATKVALTGSGATNNRYLAGVTITANATYTASLYLKAGAGAGFQAVIVFGTSGSYRAWLNTATGAITGGALSGTYTNGSMTATAVGNGWWRVALTVTTATDTTLTIETDQSSVSGGYSSAVGDYFYIWGAQLEAGAFATSYIPTVASQVTRAADSASMIGNNFARWYNGNTNTFYTEVSYYGQLIGSATETNGIYLNDGTVLNQVSVRTVRDLTAPQADVVVVSASSTQLDSAGLVPVLANTVYRRAFAYATNSALNCINGALDGSTSTPFVLPTSINKLSVPGTFTAMHIKRIAYYNRRLSNTELQGITS